ncbi:MAG: hypothetical protein M3Y72_16410 [Acidobacteriota bacterium]|nr:hypothetical protein [Acidobacteriota bacterium]
MQEAKLSLESRSMQFPRQSHPLLMGMVDLFELRLSVLVSSGFAKFAIPDHLGRRTGASTA